MNTMAENDGAGSSAADEHLVQSFNWGTSNNNGNLQSISTSPNYPQFLTFATSFAYDGVNQLLSASDTGGWAQYDQYGNMWTSAKSGMPTSGLMPTSNVFTNPNRIAGASSQYNAAGNQTVLGADRSPTKRRTGWRL